MSNTFLFTDVSVYNNRLTVILVQLRPDDDVLTLKTFGIHNIDFSLFF